MYYGCINGITLYRNFWILILGYLPEAFWCKLYLNSKFILFLKSRKSMDSYKDLSKQGKLESLEFLNVNFSALCRSNIYAVQRYCYYNDINVNLGLYSAIKHNKIDIICYLIKSGAKINIDVIFIAITNFYIDLLDILKLVFCEFASLELCYDDENLVIIYNNSIRIGKYKTINFLEKYGFLPCHCHNLNNHILKGQIGQVGARGSCGIGVKCRFYDNYHKSLSKYK